jgi:hypothetical protein
MSKSIKQNASRRNPRLKIINPTTVPDDCVEMTPELQALGHRIFSKLIKETGSPQEILQILIALYINLTINFASGDVDDQLSGFCSIVKDNLALIAQDQKPEMVS